MSLVTIFSLDNQNPEIFYLRRNWTFVVHLVSLTVSFSFPAHQKHMELDLLLGVI